MIKKIHTLLIFVLFFQAGHLYAEKTVDVFVIRSNVIKSWIQYSIKLTGDFNFIGNEPVFGFRKRPGGSRRELSYFESRYYGIESQRIINDSTIELGLKAFPSRKVIIEIKNRTVISYIDINGKKCVFIEAMIYAKKGLLTSYTGYADIIGMDIESKTKVYERINK
ncbi:MAG: DUF4833 domain-containing protein [Spirochaetota bacterium]